MNDVFRGKGNVQHFGACLQSITDALQGLYVRRSDSHIERVESREELQVYAHHGLKGSSLTEDALLVEADDESLMSREPRIESASFYMSGELAESETQSAAQSREDALLGGPAEGQTQVTRQRLQSLGSQTPSIDRTELLFLEPDLDTLATKEMDFLPFLFSLISALL